MSASRFLNKFLRFNSVIINNAPNVDLTTKISTLNYTSWYFTFLQKDFEQLEEKVARLEKELGETKTKLENGCGCLCNKN
jgi:hypothetical protein